MIEEKYLEICISPSEFSPNIKKFITTKLKEKHLHKEIQGKMITDIKINNLNNMPLPNTSILNISMFVPVKVVYKNI